MKANTASPNRHPSRRVCLLAWVSWSKKSMLPSVCSTMSAARKLFLPQADSSGYAGEFREDLVGLLECFLRPDVEPESGHTPGINRRARVKPLDQSARLVGVVAFGDVLLDQRDGAFWIKIKRN